jgi:hypothetical protein
MKLSTIHKLVHATPGGELSLCQIVGRLSKSFTRYPWIRFRQGVFPVRHLQSGYSMPTDDVLCVSGYFDPDIEGEPVCVVTVNNCSEHQKKKIDFTRNLRQQILFDVFATIAHERIHLLQHHKAKACPRPRHDTHPNPIIQRNRRYYGSTNEIDAYGFTAALEDMYGFRSDISTRYREMFSLDDPLYKRFLKKRTKYRLTMPPSVI